LLGRQRRYAPEFCPGQSIDIDAAYFYHTGIIVIKSEQQRCQRAFAGAVDR
jgi:hypothetical protein